MSIDGYLKNICFEFPLTLHYTPLQPKLHIMIVLRLICYIHVYYLNGTDQSTLLCAVMKSTCMCGSVGKLKLMKMLIYDKVQELLVLKINDQLMKYREMYCIRTCIKKIDYLIDLQPVALCKYCSFS